MITTQQLEQIGQLAAAGPVYEGLVGQLRNRFPDIHFTFCMDDDVMAAKALYEDPAFNLYLIDSSNHCLSFTQDMDVATGVVLEEIETDQ